MSKNILVTGVSQGLGLAIARAVLNQGWTVSGVSRHLSDEYSMLQREHGDRARFHPFDLNRTDDVKAELFDKFLPFELPLHGYVNNAAVAYDDIVTNLDATRLRAMYEVNVFAPMMITRYAIRHMLFNRITGSIVHISSISVHTGYKGLAMYASTKGALEAFSKNTAREWGERSIRSNCVVAGFIETAMSGSLSAEQKQRIYQRTALKEATRIESVAATVVFLLGEGAASVTGQNIFVDSGTI
ncbi:MAG: SDR family NAD(P)-dependent oxidoreductase [Opitutaceae bacterium]|nr:SDR family NAD(P)-dependent oxidoreductase [Opitutaceae bacterium]